MYDDCRDAFGSLSPSALRQALTAEGDIPELRGMTDDDVRGLLKLGCFFIAAGEGFLFGGEAPLRLSRAASKWLSR